MPSRDDNERTTRTGPGTPVGKLLRQYWQPSRRSLCSPRESKRASIGLVGCPHEGGEFGIEARRVLPERSMTDPVIQRELGA
jgi:hypothetical protein